MGMGIVMASPSVEALLERHPLSLTAIEWRIVMEADPAAFTEFLARLEARADDDATRRQLLAQRLQASVPFTISRPGARLRGSSTRARRCPRSGTTHP